MADSKRIWDYLTAITKSKDASVLKDLDFEKHYKAFLINRALSQHQDTVLAANMMNERHHLPVELQFRFLLNTVRVGYRKPHWLKNSVSDDAKNIAEYYRCSQRQATALISLHTPEQLSTIRKRLDKGGSNKAPAS